MPPVIVNNPAFLADGGEMGELTRAKDWGKTSLGPAEQWPQSLKTTLSILLNSKFPMFLWWGPELTCFYNDAYRPSLGKEGKHPSILGMPGKEAWAEIWYLIGPLVNQVLQGAGATWNEDMLVPIYRNGQIEDVYWTFSYSPVKDESGNICGVLVACTETTSKVYAFRGLEEANRRFYNNIMQAPMAMCVFRGSNYIVEIANDKMVEFWGKTAEEVLNKPIFEGLPEVKGQGFEALLEQVFTTGEKFVAYEQPVNLPRNGKIESTYVNFVYEALKEPDGTISGIVAIATEVTQQVIARQKIEESEERFRTMAEGTNILIAVADETSYATYFNKAWTDLTGRAVADLINYGWADIIHPEDRDEYVNIYLTAFKDKVPFRGEFRVLNKDGNYTWLLAQGPPRFRTDGSFAGYISSCVDITERKLAEEERKKLISILDASHEFIGLTGIDGKVQYINPEGLKMLGWDTIEGRKIIDCVYPEDREFATRIISELVAEGSFRHEIRLWNERTGKPFWIQGNGVTIRDPKSGEVTALATMSPDITARKQTDEELKQSERRFRSLVESAPFPIAVYIGEEMRIEVANQSIIDIWGKGNDVNGKLFTDVLPELASQKVFEQIKDVYHTGKDFHIKNQRLDLIVNGKPWTYYFNYSFTALTDATGKVFGVMNTGVDLTDLNTAKQKTEESEKRFRKVADTAPVMIWMSDIEGNGTFFNTAWADFTGDTTGPVNRNIWAENAWPADLQNCLETYNKAMENHAEFYLEYRQKKKDGQYRWVSCKGAPRITPDGFFEGYIGACMDVQDQKVFAAELEKQVKERTIELQQKNEELEKKNKELQSFAYVSSHDMQEPLRKIQTFASMVIDRDYENLSEGGKTYFNRMQASAAKMQLLINDLLSYSRTSPVFVTGTPKIGQTGQSDFFEPPF